MVEFLFVLLSSCRLSVSKFDDTVSKFQLYMVDLIHCYTSRLSDFQLEGTLRTTGIWYTQFQFSPEFAFCKLYPTPHQKEKKGKIQLSHGSKVSGNGTSFILPLVSSPMPGVGQTGAWSS